MTDQEELSALRREVAELRREVAELRLAALCQSPRTLPLSPAPPNYPTGPWWGGPDDGPIQFERRFGGDYTRPVGLCGGGATL